MRKIVCIIFFLLACALSAQVPGRQGQNLYNNLSKEYPSFLNADEARQIESKLENFSNQTSNQICVVIVDDLGGTTPADFATKLINEWGIGKKDKNNGVVVLIKPTKEGTGQRELFIGVGYGLEGAIPDLATKRIREEEMNPYLKSGDYFTAIDKGTDKLMALAKGEINVKDYTRHSNGDFFKNHQVLFIILIVIIFLLLKNFFGGGGGGGYTYSGRGRSYWGGFGGFGGGGGGGWGGGSGGGWGGFGGGSSGGGGSGGSW